MTFFQKVIFALVLTTPFLTAFAEERGVVRGVVVDSMTGAPSFLQEQREQRLGRYLRIDLRYSFGRFRAHTSVAHKSYDME